MKRSAVLAAAAASAVFPRGARAQGLTKVRVSGSPDNDIVGTLWGVQSGVFRKLGLDVEVTVANSGGVISAAVLGGALEIGKSSILGLLTAHAKGVGFVIEAPASLYNTDAPTSALVVAKGSRIRTGADLDGKTISVPSLGDLYQLAISSWMDQRGGDSRTVKFLELPHRAAAESIAVGRVDAANLAEPILSDALHGGKVQVIGHAQDGIAKHFIVTSYFCSADYAAKNADVLARFRKGLFEAAAYANANRAEMVPLLAKYSGIDAKIVAQMTPTTVGVAGQLDPRLIQPMIDVAVKYKALAASFPAKDVIDPNALNA
jgi:ABC-type nitrate/sulfonate/bicarbonate transport system substrate-binding protein